MKKRRFYLLATTLAALALATDISAKNSAAKAILTQAEATSARAEGLDVDRSAVRQVVFAHLRDHNRKVDLVVVLFAAALITWLASLIRREPGPHGLPLLLLIFTGLLQFVLV